MANEEGENYRISQDVDFRGLIALRVRGRTAMYPLRVEAKGITLQESSKGPVGSFPLSGISKIQRQYLEDNRQRGGLSVIHLSWWYKGKCERAHMISWRRWQEMEQALLANATGNYKGKSLRYHEKTDMGTIYDCVIFKVSNQWKMVESHWLKPFLPQQEEEIQRLLPI
jgi:hypothetical protein